MPEGPLLQFEEKQLEEAGRVTIREKSLMTISCIVRGASPAVRQINWFLSGVNVTGLSEMLMEYSADEDNYESQSILSINVTKVDHRKTIVCQAEHIAWSRPATIGASINVLCEFRLMLQQCEENSGFQGLMGKVIWNDWTDHQTERERESI